MNIKCLKLTCGDEVICDLTSDDTHFYLSNPLMIILVPAANNQFNVGLAPYCTYAKDNIVPINKSAVIAEFEPEKGMYDEYNSRFGSVILPKQQGFKLQ